MLLKKRNSIPFWKKSLSFLYPFLLESSTEPYYLELVLDNNILKLHSRNANQSNENLKKAFDILFHQIELYKSNNKKLLLYGLGLGSVIDLLQKKSVISYLNAIENDERVLHWLEKYYEINFGINENNNQKYDIIIVDIFVDNQIPELVSNLKFWEDLKSKLNPNGIIIWNTLIDYPQHLNFDINQYFTSNINIIQLNKFWIYEH